MVKKEGVRGPDLLLLLIPLVFILDRFVKIYAVDACVGVFCFSRVLNNGAAFGILQGKTLLLILVGVLVLILIASIYRKSSNGVKIALVLIAAGTVSNMYDRVVFGAVIDILSVFGGSSFNIADLSNLFGALILAKVLIKGYSGKKVFKQRKSHKK